MESIGTANKVRKVRGGGYRKLKGKNGGWRSSWKEIKDKVGGNV